MKCALCHKEITNYDARFNHLKINESDSAEICRDCIDKIMRWQGSVIRDLFPTKAAKRYNGKS